MPGHSIWYGDELRREAIRQSISSAYGLTIQPCRGEKAVRLWLDKPMLLVERGAVGKMRGNIASLTGCGHHRERIEPISDREKYCKASDGCANDRKIATSNVLCRWQSREGMPGITEHSITMLTNLQDLCGTARLRHY